MKYLKNIDFLGYSFQIIFISLLGVTLFLILQLNNMKYKWRLPLTISILVTFIASIHYYYMSKIWNIYKINPITYRYMDWFLTVPLQIIEFYLIISVVKKLSLFIFFKLLLLSFLMILFGFLGELKIINRNIGFLIGSIMWLIILYSLFFGKLSNYQNNIEDKSVISAYNFLKWIVTLGWLIYPIGYLLKYKKMNIIYNFGDFINKILFVLIIWYFGKYNILI